MDVDSEVAALVEELQRFGGRVEFGVLCRDDQVSNRFEALGGILKAAKRRKVVGYDSELLLQGAHDDVEVFLIETVGTGGAKQPDTKSAADTAATAPTDASEEDKGATTANADGQVLAPAAAEEHEPSSSEQAESLAASQPDPS